MAVEEVKRRNKKVKEAVIESKDQRWHCRNRVTLVFGSNELTLNRLHHPGTRKILFWIGKIG